jgi:ubiquinol-cytochrome c reductase cytochrome b subunit
MDQSKFSDFLESRFGLSNLKKVFLDKPIKINLNWLFTMGSVCLFLFVLQALTGIILAMYYVPSPDHAYLTVEYINKELSYGWLVRGIHHWSANFLIVAAIFHLLRSFYYGAYKAPREFTWISGVLLLILILGFGFTGYLFAWDQRAYWATVVGLNFFTVIPVVGKFVSHLFMGGPEVSAITLTRFYTIHILILPLLTVMLTVIHIYLVRLHNTSGPITDMDPEEIPTAPFYPYHMIRDVVVCLIVFFAILVVASFFKIESQAVAGTWDPSYLPRPEWYFLPLFEILKYFEGKFEIVGVIGIPLLIFGVLILLPFLGRNEEKKPMNRPIALGAALAVIIGIGHLGILGAKDNPEYGKEIIVPAKVMAMAELKGISSYVDRDCAYCHNILGRGGS